MVVFPYLAKALDTCKNKYAIGLEISADALVEKYLA